MKAEEAEEMGLGGCRGILIGGALLILLVIMFTALIIAIV